MRAATRLALGAKLAAAGLALAACAPQEDAGAARAEGEAIPIAAPAAARAPDPAGRSPYFDEPVLPPGGISVALTGSDPEAPRALGLWRSDRARGEPELLQVAASDREGRFDFGQWLVPVAGAEWTVAPIERGDPASAPERSRLRLSLGAAGRAR